MCEYQASSYFCAGGNHHFCSYCGECIEPGCSCNKGGHKLKIDIKYRTQKAQCIEAIHRYLPYNTVQPFIFTDLFDSIHNRTYFMSGVLARCGSLFARPCPQQPRHGFVDSRQISSYEELLTVFEETKKADPLGEVVVMPFVEASYNMVYANGSLTIGPGHDGATNGNEAITILTSNDLPFSPKIGPTYTQKLLKAANITEAPYVEAIIPTNFGEDVIYTQLRNGPKIECKGNDYIPKTITVKTIIRANKDIDLLQWEEDCVRYATQNGLVVVHEGGAISSHFGVHCIINGIPYLTTFTPKIGDILRPTQRREKEPNLKAFFDGFFVGLELEIKPRCYTALMAFVLSTLHNIPFATANETIYLGAAIALLIRLGIAACFGEVRHYNGEKRVIEVSDRHIVYEKVFKNLSPYLKDLPIVQQVFSRGIWSSSYGGKKWANCTEQTIRLWNNVCRLYRKRTEGNYKRLISQFNTVINCAHNGGWWLNKYCSKSMFDNASICASWAVMSGSRYYYEIHKAKKQKWKNELMMRLTIKPISENYLTIISSDSEEHRRDKD